MSEPTAKGVLKGLAFAGLLVTSQATALAGDFYMEPSGSDKNPGTKTKPFHTIAHARDSVAKIKSKTSGDKYPPLTASEIF